MIQQREASGSICHPDASRLLLKGLFFQVCFDVAGYAAHERVDRFARGPCVVGRSEQTVGVAQGEQGVVGLDRLRREDVECGAGDPAVVERFGQRSFVDDAAAGDVDEPGPMVSSGELLGADQPPACER